MRLRLMAAFLAASICAAAPADESLAALASAVQSALGARRSDKDIAKLVRKSHLAERLDDATLEALESSGTGPKTREELERLHDLSEGLPDPANPPILFRMPPAPSREEWVGVLNHAGTLALNYTKSMPDFLCTQTVRRYRNSRIKGPAASWTPVDTLTIRLAYSIANGEDYKLTAIDGRATFRTYEEAGGALTKGEFASILRHLFAANSHAQFRWERWSMLRARPAQVFSYIILPENSAYRMSVRLGSSEESTVVGLHGLIYVDGESGQIVRVLAEGDHFPNEFPVQKTRSVLDYGFVDVGERQFLLPLRADIRMTVPRSLETRNLVEFHDYQKFSSDATITFDRQ